MSVGICYRATVLRGLGCLWRLILGCLWPPPWRDQPEKSGRLDDLGGAWAWLCSLGVFGKHLWNHLKTFWTVLLRIPEVCLQILLIPLYQAYPICLLLRLYIGFMFVCLWSSFYALLSTNKAKTVLCKGSRCSSGVSRCWRLYDAASDQIME